MVLPQIEAIEWRARGALVVVFFSTVLLALLMGGLLWSGYVLVNLCVAAYALYLLLGSRTPLGGMGRSAHLVLLLLAVVALYAVATTGILALQVSPVLHPLLGEVSRLANPQRALRWLSQWCASMALAWIVVAACRGNTQQILRIVRMLIASGAVIAFIGIVHWFTDNGHLFWVIKPEDVFVSNRLRWPFVNCDHMAAFLVMVLFPAVAATHSAWRTTQRDLEKRGSLATGSVGSRSSSHRSLISKIRRLVRSPSAAMNLGHAVLGSLAVVTLTVAILGTLSRTTWFAMSVGFVAYGMLVATRRSGVVRLDDVVIQRRTKRTSTARTVRRIASSLVRKVTDYLPLCAIVALPLIFVVLLLQGGGGDLIEARLSSAAKNLPNDSRWTIYADSLRLFKSAPWFGIGVGQWQTLHTTMADSVLAGVSIEYAHSDLLQSLLELGIIGTLPLLGLAYLFTRSLAQIRRESDHARRRLLAGLAASLLAGLICAAFDFPLRIPAVSYLFVTVLSLHAVLLNEQSR